jgi:hypothetical protein
MDSNPVFLLPVAAVPIALEPYCCELTAAAGLMF